MTGSMRADETSSPNANRRLLVAIGIGIACAVAFGGWWPHAARHVALVGDVFLNLLMMLVIPLVMLSMIVGIAKLGDVRHLGAIGWRTVVYYLGTTAIAVTIGIVVVNVLEPGRGVSPGESHPDAAYVVRDDGHTVALEDDTWSRAGYDERYLVVLEDQNVHGRITRLGRDTATVRLWDARDGAERVYITSDDGTHLPFRRVDGTLVSSEPSVETHGRGVSIVLPTADDADPRPTGPIEIARTLLLGDEDRQGLVPRNPFRAMADFEILPLIVFSLLIGAALSTLGARAASTIEVLGTLDATMSKLVEWVLWVAPLGIFGLIAGRIGEAGGFAGFWPVLVALGRYTVTVLLALTIHGGIVLVAALWLIARRNPLEYLRGVAPALSSALSTSSSSATLPLTIDGVQRRNGVSARTASFVLPLGATINMDGTALYEAVAAIFIAQVYGIDLGPTQQAVVVLTATLAAIGAAGIPEAGLVTMLIVLRAVGLPVEGIGLLLAVDWLLDRARTTVNVWGDCVGAAVVERWLPDEAPDAAQGRTEVVGPTRE